MSQIFISYKKEDREHTIQLASVLEANGHTVWWDNELTPGRSFRDEIEAALDNCDIAIVIWTPRSIYSEFVKDEAARGQRGKKLLPVMIRRGSMGNIMDFELPLGFGQIQTLDLTDWEGSGDEPQILKLLESIKVLEDANGTEISAAARERIWRTVTYVEGAARATAGSFWRSFLRIPKTLEIVGLPLRSLLFGSIALAAVGLLAFCFGAFLLGSPDTVRGALSAIPIVFGLVVLVRLMFQFVFLVSGRSSRQFFDSAFTWVFLFSLLIATIAASLQRLGASDPNPFDLLIIVPMLTLAFMFIIALVRLSAISARLLFSRL